MYFRLNCHQLSNTFLKKVFSDSSNFAEIALNNLNFIKKDFKTSVNKLVVNA